MTNIKHKEKMKTFTILLILIIANVNAMAQSAHTFLMDGDAFYEQGDFDIAEEKYKKASEKKRTLKSEFNLGNSLYQLNRYEEAATQFERSSIIASSDDQKADALYNMANTFLQEQNLEGAIENYKHAIKLNPSDMDARRNLYLAKLMQKQQQEQEQQQQQQQDQQNQQEQDQSQSEEQQQQEQQENQDSQQQEQQESEESQIDNENEETAAEETQELNKEDAENLLEVIENEEKRVQEKLRKVSGNKKKPEKDW